MIKSSRPKETSKECSPVTFTNFVTEPLIHWRTKLVSFHWCVLVFTYSEVLWKVRQHFAYIFIINIKTSYTTDTTHVSKIYVHSYQSYKIMFQLCVPNKIKQITLYKMLNFPSEIFRRRCYPKSLYIKMNLRKQTWTEWQTEGLNIHTH